MLLVDYLAFAGRHRRLLAFGFLLTFASSAGQTFFIGIFGPDIREAFGLGHTGWGTLYLVGTLASALVLPWTGQLIDRLDLRWYVAFALTGLAAACLAISLAQSIIMLTVAIFLLRQMGQGVTSHAAATSMARYHGPDRGKALAIASIGMALGEAMLPVLAILSIAALGWRSTYAFASVIILLVLLPMALWLLRGHVGRHRRHLAAERRATKADRPAIPDCNRRQMLAEPRFYLLLPAFTAPSIIMTALFFHHLTLAEGKGWSAAWITGQYWVFALFAVVSSLAAGPMIDRLSAKRVMPLFLLPLVLALILLTPAEAPAWLLPYLALLGLTSGIAFTGFTALWAELYGTAHLGAIRSLAGAISVFASALGPVLAGVLLDAGMAMETIGLGFAGYCLIATLSLLQALRLPNARLADRVSKHPG
ncbi:MAG: MFS transporter [Alphaproteobacteria bacterium]|nr:MFS transporter [Alphaproteobacteria bacterium]